MHAQILPPHLALEPFVKCYLCCQFSLPDPVRTALCAKSDGGLMFPFKSPVSSFCNINGTATYTKKILDGSAVQGPSSTFANASFAGEVNMLIVIFQAVGLYHFMQQRAQSLANFIYALEDTDVAVAFRECQDRLWNAATPRAAVNIVEPYLLRHFSAAIQKFQCHDLSPVTQYIDRRLGKLPVEAVSRKFRISRRGLEKQFQQQVGHSPKVYSRLSRFRAVVQTTFQQPRISWMEMVSLFNYCDQSHLIHDFQEFAGQSPKQFFQANLLETADENPAWSFAF